MKILSLAVFFISLACTSVYAGSSSLTNNSGVNMQSVAEKNLVAGKEFLEQNQKQLGVVTLPDGLQYKVLKAGTGPKPKAQDTVSVHYAGTFLDGKEFDSSYGRGRPASFPVNQVIPGWTEALQLMGVGAKWELFIPANLAYGTYGMPPVIGPNQVLIFTVELLAIK